jgi:hypothetical protein
MVTLNEDIASLSAVLLAVSNVVRTLCRFTMTTLSWDQDDLRPENRSPSGTSQRQF